MWGIGSLRSVPRVHSYFPPNRPLVWELVYSEMGPTGGAHDSETAHGKTDHCSVRGCSSRHGRRRSLLGSTVSRMLRFIDGGPKYAGGVEASGWPSDLSPVSVGCATFRPSIGTHCSIAVGDKTMRLCGYEFGKVPIASGAMGVPGYMYGCAERGGGEP